MLPSNQRLERTGDDSGVPREARLVYIKEQIGFAIADAAGRLYIKS